MDSVRAHMANVEVVCDCLCGVVVEGEEGDELRSGKKDLPCSGLIRRCHI